MRFTTSELATATGGELFGRDVTVNGVGIDSRRIGRGQLFVPIVAERDGHDFIAAAASAGAAAYLTSGPIEAGTAVRVADTGEALTAVGSWARSRLDGHVVGITGSVGKTSLKDMLAAVSRTTWRTHWSVGSFNNEMGVPLTLANAPEGTEVAVVEMGARGIGHIADLCATARPTVGIVTVVAGVHLEHFQTVDDVAVGKGELVEALGADGFAVLNADDARVAAMAQRTEATVVTFGVSAGEVRASNIRVDDSLRPRFHLDSPWGSAEVLMSVAGRHQVTNALGAAAAALAIGASIDAVAAGLGGVELSAMRMDLRQAPDGFRVLDDAYNANPTSVCAALDAVAELKATRRVAVLGTMAELGPDGPAEHAAVAGHARSLGIDVVSVAEPAYGVDGVRHADDPAEALAMLRSLALGPGDVVLVKASRSAGLERVVSGLLSPA